MGGFLFMFYWQGDGSEVTPTLVGTWSNIIDTRSANQRIETY
jgi:hypothetical protein